VLFAHLSVDFPGGVPVHPLRPGNELIVDTGALAGVLNLLGGLDGFAPVVPCCGFLVGVDIIMVIQDVLDAPFALCHVLDLLFFMPNYSTHCVALSRGFSKKVERIFVISYRFI
jgi:hypothetical protein